MDYADIKIDGRLCKYCIWIQGLMKWVVLNIPNNAYQSVRNLLALQIYSTSRNRFSILYGKYIKQMLGNYTTSRVWLPYIRFNQECPVLATNIYCPISTLNCPAFLKVSVMYQHITIFMICKLKTTNDVCIIITWSFCKQDR